MLNSLINNAVEKYYAINLSSQILILFETQAILNCRFTQIVQSNGGFKNEKISSIVFVTFTFNII